MATQTNFWQKNKVFIGGVIVAMALAAQEIVTKGGDFSNKVVLYAAFLAGLSWAAKNLRGQAATLSGVLVTAFSTFMTMQEQGNIKWSQILIQAGIAAALAFFSSPPKSLEYENSTPIVKAKKEAAAAVKENNSTPPLNHARL